MKYTQCRLQHDFSEQIAWIPSYAAKVGNQVELLPSKLFWKVLEVYHSLDKEDLENQRKGSKTLLSIR
jgi:hypothetical protein